ncbi:hypothetical protein [Chitinophaga tropicalis]|uniref:Uncharacterized protein n=1 Tax=Chitinophaga tropicalis TaxID=2683588 RepID=A0A7K1TZX3_9BACT|nr:hypothetical protein [Chitinophaga tropicalis]MVT07669.1 hypothetical protein [Chitinophaga tropicalis]
MEPLVTADTLSDGIVQLTPEQLPVLTNFMTRADALAINAKLLEETSFQQFLTLWNQLHCKTANQQSLISLYGGYYCQQAAEYCENGISRQDLLIHAQDHYMTFLEDDKMEKEVRYFAQWQLGLTKELQGKDWGEVEETLLSASNYHNGRGEAMRHVIQYYRNSKQYGLGYIYSSIAKEQYLGKVPEEIGWFGDVLFYQWKILYYHTSICGHIKFSKEAEDTFYELWRISQIHPEYFTSEQLQSLFQNMKSYKS